VTRTRCQNIAADKITVNLQLNDPNTLADNAYPRTVQVFAQDQMIEGGSDKIASGNSTPVAPLAGDAVINALREILAPLAKP